MASLLIGSLFLGTCLLISHLLQFVETNALVGVLRESLTIGGWVAMWRPMDQTCMRRGSSTLPVGKPPPGILAKLLGRFAPRDARVVVGPGLGLDCSVVRGGQQLLVFKSDPITFATEDIGYYLVRINANDLATTGAQPRWLLVTILLPERQTKAKYVQRIAREIDAACREIGVVVIGGHTEITYGLHRPILVGTLVGEVEPGGLVTPKGAHPGDSLLLTKGVPIEATAILAREFPERFGGRSKWGRT